jgi:hypothetical protein
MERIIWGILIAVDPAVSGGNEADVFGLRRPFAVEANLIDSELNPSSLIPIQSLNLRIKDLDN